MSCAFLAQISRLTTSADMSFRETGKERGGRVIIMAAWRRTRPSISPEDHGDDKTLTVTIAAFLGVAAVQASDWPQWQGPDRTGLSKETGLLKEWPAGGPPSSGRRPASGPASARWRPPGIACTSRPPSAAPATSSRSTAPMARSSGRRPSDQPRGTIKGNGPRSTPTIDGDRLYVLTENGDLACLEDGRRHPVATKYPAGFPWPPDPVVDQRVPTRGWAARRRVAGRIECGHREAGQDDGRDRVDVQRPQRCGRVFLRDRRRCGRRAHLHDVHRLRRCRRAGLRR